MDDEFDAAHDELRSVARGLLGKNDHDTPADWSQIARSGWLGLEAPAEFDGAEATFAEVAVLLEEVGRAAARSAFPSVAALGLGALGLLQGNTARDKLFREAVAGDAVPVLVMPGEWDRGFGARPGTNAESSHANSAPDGPASADDSSAESAPASAGVPGPASSDPAAADAPPDATAARTAPGEAISPSAQDGSAPLDSGSRGSAVKDSGGAGSDFVLPDIGEPVFRLAGEAGSLVLCGSAEFVPDACAAGRLLIPARAPDGTIVLVVVGPGADGLTVTEQPVVDATRAFGRVVAEGVAVSPESVLRFSGDPAAALRRLCDRAAVATACDSLGLSAAMLDATVEYVRVREQFGRPVGSFQAVKHACADMLVQITVAGQLVRAAVRAQVEQAPDATTAASMAKAFTTDMAVRVTGKAMQLHGGIGYTWESGIHVYLKRATLNRTLFGTPSHHRTRLSRRYR